MLNLLNKYIMGLLIIVISAGTFGIPLFVDAYVSVRGYYRSDGTYVRPHVRSNPNGLKYDNYSYKPSQGLYNDTYGTRGTTWDTPTYTTDPDYYEGKSLYESGSSSYGTYSPSTYTSPTYTSGIKSVYGGTLYGTSLYCDSGYYKNGGSCIKAPANSYAGVSSFYCDYGYEKSGNSCIKTTHKPYVSTYSYPSLYTTTKRFSYQDSEYDNVRNLKIYSGMIQRIAYNEDLSCKQLFPLTNQAEDVAMCNAYRKIDNPKAWTEISRKSNTVRSTVTPAINNPMLASVSSSLEQNTIDDLQSQIDSLLKMVESLQAQIK